MANENAEFGSSAKSSTVPSFQRNDGGSGDGVAKLSEALNRALAERADPDVATINNARFNQILEDIKEGILAGSLSGSGKGEDKDKKDDKEKQGDLLNRSFVGAGKLIGETITGVVTAPFKAIPNVVGGVLGSALKNNAGAKVFGSSLEVLATTVGTALIPVFVGLAAGALALSDYLWESLLPNMERWTEAVLGFFKYVASIPEGAIDTGQKILDGNFSGVWEKHRGDFKDTSKEGGLLSVIPPDPNLGAGDYSKDEGPKPSKFQTAFKDVLTEMRRASGGQASFGGLADASRNAQLAAFQSPFERRVTTMMEKMMTALEKTATNTSPNKLATGGDF